MSQTLSPPIVRVSIAQLMGIIAVIASVCAWPWLLIPVVPALIYACLRRIGRQPETLVSLMVTLILPTEFTIALLLPFMITARRPQCGSRLLRAATAPSPPNVLFSSVPLGVFVLDGSTSIARLTDDGQEKARPMWSPDGKRLAFARHESGGSHIWQYVMDAGDPKSARRLTDRKPPEFHAAFAPDGKTLALAIVEQSGTQGNVDIALIGSDGANLKRVVGDISGKLSHQDWPSWSPDGSRFAFSSTHEGNQEIYTAKSDGSDVVRLTQSPGHDAHPCWSPDGKSIAFATDRWGGLELAAVSPDGTGLTRLTKSPGLDDFPSYSPDGKSLAFASHRDGQLDIYAANADGSGPVNLTNHPARDTQPTWTPDGQGVTFVSDREGGTDLYTIKVGR